MPIIGNAQPIDKIIYVDISPYPHLEIVQTMLFLRQPWSKMSKDNAYVIFFLLQDTTTQTQFGSNLGYIYVTWHGHIEW